jgi:hypothetical protein
MALEQVPSCSRCTQKGLHCEPRSTRRTSDSNYRNTKKHLVSPKRYPTANTIPTIGRHTSPRSVPSADRHQLFRAVSQMDLHAAAKMSSYQRPGFTAMPMLTPLQTYTPQIIDGCYSHSSSPERSIAPFNTHVDKTTYLSSGRLTPQTPEFTYKEPVAVTDSFNQYMNSHAWSDDGHMHIGLGFENDIPGLMPGDTDLRLWAAPNLDGNSTPMGSMSAYDSPVSDTPTSLETWPTQPLSVSPPQLAHTRAVPSLSMSEASAQDFDSPGSVQEEWSHFRNRSGEMGAGNAMTSAPYIANVQTLPVTHQVWDSGVIPRKFLMWSHIQCLNRLRHSLELHLCHTVLVTANSLVIDRLFNFLNPLDYRHPCCTLAHFLIRWTIANVLLSRQLRR